MNERQVSKMRYVDAAQRMTEPFATDVSLAKIHAQVAIGSMAAFRDGQILWIWGHNKVWANYSSDGGRTWSDAVACTYENGDRGVLSIIVVGLTMHVEDSFPVTWPSGFSHKHWTRFSRGVKWRIHSHSTWTRFRGRVTRSDPQDRRPAVPRGGPTPSGCLRNHILYTAQLLVCHGRHTSV